MHEHRDENALSDDALDRAIQRALAIDPSPRFVPRLRARLASEPVPRWGFSWKLAIVLAAVSAAALTAVRSARQPVSSPAAPVPLVFRDEGSALRPAAERPQNKPETKARTSVANTSAFKSSLSTGRRAAEPTALANTTGSAPSSPSRRRSVAEPLRGGRDVSAPRKVVDVKPVYPEAARAARAEGVVVAEILIAIDGSISRARIVSSIPLLDQAALDAVKRWKFEPTALNGTPVEVVMDVLIRFTLN